MMWDGRGETGGDEAAPRTPDPLSELERLSEMRDKARARADQLRDKPRIQEWDSARRGSGEGSAAGAEVRTLFGRGRRDACISRSMYGCSELRSSHGLVHLCLHQRKCKVKGWRHRADQLVFVTSACL